MVAEGKRGGWRREERRRGGAELGSYVPRDASIGKFCWLPVKRLD